MKHFDNPITKNHYITVLLLILATIILGASFPLLKATLEQGVPVFLLLTFQFSIATLAIFIFKIFRHKTIRTSKNSFKKGSKIGFVMFVALGIQNLGLTLTTPVKSSMLSTVHILIIPIIISIKQRVFSKKCFTEAMLCIFGMMIFFNIFDRFANFGIGDFLTILSACIMAIHMLDLEKAIVKNNVIDLTFWQMLSSAVLSLILSLVIETPLYTSVKWEILVPSATILGIICTAFIYLVESYAHKHFSANVVSIIMSLEAIFTIIFSIAIGLDKFSLWYILGGAIIVVAVIRSILIKPSYDTFLHYHKIKESHIEKAKKKVEKKIYD